MTERDRNLHYAREALEALASVTAEHLARLNAGLLPDSRGIAAHYSVGEYALEAERRLYALRVLDLAERDAAKSAVTAPSAS